MRKEKYKIQIGSKRGVMKAMAVLTVFGSVFAGCGQSAQEVKNLQEVQESQTTEKADTEQVLQTDQKSENDSTASITIFAAKSLNTVMEELISTYNETHQEITIVGNYDSSGTLMTQIEEGAPCDVFFSAAEKQMDQLETDGLLVDGTRADVVNNQVCVVTYKDSGTEVSGLLDMWKAADSGIALADGSVPVGKYTRQAMVNAGLLEETEDVSSISAEEIAAVLKGVTINECANVGAVAAAVAEQSNEVGTVYYSDTYGMEDQLEILEIISYDLTGNVIYPVAQIKNEEADAEQQKAAADFVKFLTSEEAKEIYRKYYFDTELS